MSTIDTVKEKIEDEVGKRALNTVKEKVKKKVGNDKLVDTIGDYVEDFLFDDDKKKKTTKSTKETKKVEKKSTKKDDSKLDDIIDLAKEFIGKDK